MDQRPTLSIIVPTLDEAARISATIEAARRGAPDAQILVVDGGSSDATRARAKAAGAEVLEAPRGRGTQLRRGAERAGGDVLIFLHADTLLSPGAGRAIRQALADPAVIGGNFRVLFEGERAFARWLTGFYAWFRSKGLYYGDSVIFLRREAYLRLGGIRPLALMEDYDLSRRMERLGRTCCIATPPVVTSSRRFEGRRPVAIFCGWLLIHMLFYLRLPAAWLAGLYDSERRRRVM